MGQKAITIYTPEGTAAHITAEDDAFIHRCMLGGTSGILGSLSCVKVDDNTVRLSNGGVSNKGFILWIPNGETVELAVDNGEPGMSRVDIVAAAFTKGGGEVADTHIFRIIKGTAAASNPAAPAVTTVPMAQLTAGSTLELALFYVNITGSEITGINQAASKLPAASALPGIYVQQSQPSSPATGDLWFW